MNISVKEVAAMVDHTNLKAYATRDDFRKLCDEAIVYGFKSVAINTYPVRMCREMLEGTEVLGTCIAEELIQDGIRITNEHGTIYVVTPELTSSNQIIFRSNTAHLIRNRHVLILAASIATGAMVLDAVNAVKYYGGMPEGICAIFSAGQKCAGLPITTIFSSELLGDFMCAPATDCPLCKAGVKLDALVNSYGISSL